MNAIPSSPLTPRGRRYAWLTILGVAALWLLTLACLFNLPETIPVHFGLSGQPTRYGSKLELLILPAAFSLAPVIILVITRYRFKLINDHPYLVNLPAFFVAHLPDLPSERQSWWVNRLFEANLALGAGLTWLMVLMEWIIFQGTASGRMAGRLTALSLTLILIPIIGYILYLRKMGADLAREARETA